MKPPPLTKNQRNSLAILEPQLRTCVLSGDFALAKKLTTEIQELLRPTGHETRLLQAKNWLYECAIEANKFSFAERGFIGTRAKANKNTRLYLEATALLAVCFTRRGAFEKARPLVIETLNRINNISSDTRRRQFHRRLLHRLEEEAVLASLFSSTPSLIDVDRANNLAIEYLTQNKSEQQLLVELGKALPTDSTNLVSEVRDVFERRLPPPDRRALPPPTVNEDGLELGRRSQSALKRVAWKALCDTDSPLYKDWTTGLSAFYDKKTIMAALAAAFLSASLVPPLVLAAGIAALAFRFGAAVFCEKYQPSSLMIERSDSNES